MSRFDRKDDLFTSNPDPVDPAEGELWETDDSFYSDILNPAGAPDDDIPPAPRSYARFHPTAPYHDEVPEDESAEDDGFYDNGYGSSVYADEEDSRRVRDIYEDEPEDDYYDDGDYEDEPVSSGKRGPAAASSFAGRDLGELAPRSKRSRSVQDDYDAPATRGKKTSRSYDDYDESAPHGKKSRSDYDERYEELSPAPKNRKKKKEPEDEPFIPTYMKDKKRTAFKRGLRAYLIVLAVIFIGLLAAVWVILTRYQANKDIEAAEKAEAEAAALAQAEYEKNCYRAPQLTFEDWLAEADAETWTALWYEQNPEAIDGRDRVKEYLGELFASDTVEAFRSLDYSAESPVYVLKDGDRRLARIEMQGSELDWTVSKAELELKGEKSASVRAAVGSTVYCNGEVIGSEYASEPTSDIPNVLSDIRDRLVNPVSWTVYTVDGMLLDPEITADPPEGCTVTETGSGDFMLCLEEGDTQTYKDRAVAFAQSYERFTSNVNSDSYGNMYAVLNHLTADTYAYNTIVNAREPIYWVAARTIVSSENNAGEVVIWADNCYSVDVTYSMTCTVAGEEEHPSGVLRCYFVNYGAGFILSHFEML